MDKQDREVVTALFQGLLMVGAAWGVLYLFAVIITQFAQAINSPLVYGQGVILFCTVKAWANK